MAKGKRYFLMGEFLKVNSKMVKKRVLVVSMIKVVKLFKEVFGQMENIQDDLNNFFADNFQ